MPPLAPRKDAHDRIPEDKAEKEPSPNARFVRVLSHAEYFVSTVALTGARHQDIEDVTMSAWTGAHRDTFQKRKAIQRWKEIRTNLSLKKKLDL